MGSGKDEENFADIKIILSEVDGIEKAAKAISDSVADKYDESPVFFESRRDEEWEG